MDISPQDGTTTVGIPMNGIATAPSVVAWLEATADRVPNRLAVADPNARLTFDELRQTARRMAAGIAAYVQPRQAVALYLEKSPLALAAMLGAAYAGAFYSVVDVRQPAPRVQAILKALEAPLVLVDETTEGALRALLAAGPASEEGAASKEGETSSPALRIVRLDELASSQPNDAVIAARRAQAADTDPLYVNFTSGSTGTPKGVVVGHRSVLDFIPTFTRTFGIGEDDVLANQAPFDFDVSVKDIYSCLSTGATMWLVPRAYFSNPTQLMDYLCETEATTLVWAVSALCFVSIMGGLEYRLPTTVSRVMFSGEVMPPKQLAIWQDRLPRATFVNLYGPTEITCNCTYYVVERAYGPGETIPMGRPFANETVFLLDERDQLVGPERPGVEGEVCVAGTCLALGYLGEPARTAEAFVQNPLNTRWRQTIYRTGDLARYDERGDLVYASRKDHQIKHLGQRIELGDIEAAANGVDGVEQTCCLYDAQRKRIVLYYAGTTDRKALKARLRELLPSYMVPNNTRQLDALPLTKNGKVDRGALVSLKAR